MERYARIATILQTVFNAEDGLSPETSRRLYARTILASAALVGFKEELAQAFADPTVSWKQMLCNDHYEVLDAETEQQAKEFAFQLLLAPLLEAE